jgi:hypothetical protein
MTPGCAAAHHGSMSTPQEIPPQQRRLAAVLLLVAVSLAVESALHLSGAVHPRGSDETQAGAAEAVICVALLCGAGSLARRGPAGYRAALWATVFAIAGFCLGLSITVPSGYIPDIAYHATVLPILIITCTLLLRSARPGDGAGQAPRQDSQAVQR